MTDIERELYHHGVKGMRWGVRKKLYGASTGGFIPKKPKGQQPGWQHQKTERQKRWEDDHGINPNRPNGTSPKKSKNLKTAAAYGTIAVASFLVAYGATSASKARRTVSTGMLEKTLSHVNAMNRLY